MGRTVGENSRGRTVEGEQHGVNSKRRTMNSRGKIVRENSMEKTACCEQHGKNSKCEQHFVNSL